MSSILTECRKLLQNDAGCNVTLELARAATFVVALGLSCGVTGCRRNQPAEGWSWEAVPGTACSDGSATGIGLHRSTTGSKDVIVVMAGGGQCWDYDSCFVREETIVGPFGPAEFAKESKRFQGVLSIGDGGNPFRDWNIVFVPYCTGDFHGGDNVATYTDPAGKKRSFSHVGHRNIAADVAHLRGLFPSPPRLVVSGISAGGYGAVMNYSTFREGWPAGATYLVDDSGPFLPGDAIRASDRAAMYTNWGLDQVLEPLCGQARTACRDDLSVVPARVAASYPKDRMALVSSLRDHDISDTFHISPEKFETALLGASAKLDTTGNFRTFLIRGNTHMTFTDPVKFSENGVLLTTWLKQLVNNDPAWASIRPQ